MSVTRLVQNFSQRRAVIASCDRRTIDALTMTLQKLGVCVDILKGCEAGQKPMAFEGDPAREVLFLDGDMNVANGGAFGSDTALSAVPVIGLVGVEAPSRLRTLLTAGATAFLSKPIYGGSVYSALYLGINEHARRARLQADVDELEARRRLRRHVIRAVVNVMAAHGVNDEAAYQILRREAMRERLALETYCERLVLSGAPPSAVDTASPLRQAVAD